MCPQAQKCGAGRILLQFHRRCFHTSKFPHFRVPCLPSYLYPICLCCRFLILLLQLFDWPFSPCLPVAPSGAVLLPLTLPSCNIFCPIAAVRIFSSFSSPFSTPLQLLPVLPLRLLPLLLVVLPPLPLLLLRLLPLLLPLLPVVQLPSAAATLAFAAAAGNSAATSAAASTLAFATPSAAAASSTAACRCCR